MAQSTVTTLLALLLWPALLLSEPPAPTTAPLPPGIVARVNGQSIPASDLERGLRSDLEPGQRSSAREERLQRLVLAALVDQALTRQHLSVSSTDIDREYAQLKQSPPLMSCGDCRFSSLEEYLQLNAMSEDDLRLDIRHAQGIDLLVDAAWKALHPASEDEQKLISAEASHIKPRYRKVWWIYVKGPMVVPETKESARQSEAARSKLEAALAEVAKGASFENVARRYSEDASTAAQGGLFGYRPTDQPLLGIIDARRWPALQPGVVHGPYRSWAGYHAVKIQPLTDADVLEILHSEFASKHAEEIQDRLCTQATIEPPTLLQKQ